MSVSSSIVITITTSDSGIAILTTTNATHVINMSVDMIVKRIVNTTVNMDVGAVTWSSARCHRYRILVEALSTRLLSTVGIGVCSERCVIATLTTASSADTGASQSWLATVVPVPWTAASFATLPTVPYLVPVTMRCNGRVGVVRLGHTAAPDSVLTVQILTRRGWDALGGDDECWSTTIAQKSRWIASLTGTATWTVTVRPNHLTGKQGSPSGSNGPILTAAISSGHTSLALVERAIPCSSHSRSRRTTI